MVTLLRHEGRHLEAVRLTEELLTLPRCSDHRRIVIAMLAGAQVLHELGRHDEAYWMLVGALPTARASIHTASVALGLFGSVNLALGRPDAARVVLLWAIRLSHRSGNVGGAAESLSDYGRALAVLGATDAALCCQRQAYEQACAQPDGYFVPTIANHLGATLTLAGRHDEALALDRRALHEAELRPRPYERARANAGIAAALRDRDPEAAARAPHTTAIWPWASLRQSPIACACPSADRPSAEERLQLVEARLRRQVGAVVASGR